MGSISGDVNSGPLQCTTAADLASRPVASLKVGDWAYVIAKQGTSEGPLFFWSPASVLGASASVIVSTAVGGGAGRWLSFAVHGGVAVGIEPFSHDFYVDAGTATAFADQDGSVAAPFATIQQGIDAVAASVPVFGTITGTVHVTSGFYEEGLDFSVLETVGSISLDILGDGLETTIIFGTLSWTPVAETVVGGIRLQGFSYLGSIYVDGSAVTLPFLNAYGFWMQDCYVEGAEGTSVEMISCGTFVSINTEFVIGSMLFTDCGAHVDAQPRPLVFRDSKVVTTELFGVTFRNSTVTPTPVVNMYGSDFDGGAIGVCFFGDIAVVADGATTFNSIVKVSGVNHGVIGPTQFTASGRFKAGLDIHLLGGVGDDVAAVVDISRCSFAGPLTTEVTGGDGRTTLHAKNAVFGGDATISLETKVDADFRGAIFNQENMTGDTTATCRRSVYYKSEDISAAVNAVAIPAPPFPDANYTIELTAQAVIASSPWAITDQAEDEFEISLTAPNPGLLAHIVLTPFDNAPP